jgi:ketosteroid isomerase-like protein
MKIRTFLFSLLVLFVGFPLAAQEGEDPDRDAVRNVIETVAAGMQAGDFASLDTLFTDSRGLHIIEGAGVNHGWADYRDNHLAPELEAFENFSYRWFAIEPVVDGDASWAAFRYELAADTQGGHVEIEGRGTLVLQRRDGQWKVVHMHTSGRRK